jgi:hypothetical protein
MLATTNYQENFSCGHVSDNGGHILGDLSQSKD